MTPSLVHAVVDLTAVPSRATVQLPLLHRHPTAREHELEEALRQSEAVYDTLCDHCQHLEVQISSLTRQVRVLTTRLSDITTHWLPRAVLDALVKDCRDRGTT